MKRFISLLLTTIATTLLAQATSGEAPLSAISYEEAITKILDRSTDVAAQKAELDAVHARTLSSRLTLLPSLTVQAQQQKSEQQGFKTDRQGLSIGAQLNLFKFGADAAAMSAARAEIAAQERKVAATVIAVEDKAVSTLNHALQADMEVDILKRIVQMRQESLRIAEERFRRGLLAQQEVLKVSVDLDNDGARLRDSEIEAAQAAAALKELLGVHSVRAEWPWKESIDERSRKLLGVSDSALSNRPDWTSAEASVRAAEKRSSQAWGQFLPSLDLGVNYGYFDTHGMFGNYRGPEWVGAISLTIPLFDKLAGYGRYKDLASQSLAAEQDLERVRRLARRQWEGSRVALETGIQTAKARESTLATSRKLYADNLQRFQRSLINANDLRIDQERLFSSELLAVRGWSAAHLNYARLCHSLGKQLSQCFNEH